MTLLDAGNGVYPRPAASCPTNSSLDTCHNTKNDPNDFQIEITFPDFPPATQTKECWVRWQPPQTVCPLRGLSVRLIL
jgi:hypothetical protein